MIDSYLHVQSDRGVNGVLVQPLSYRDPERVMNFWVDFGIGAQSLPAMSPGDFKDYQQRSSLFESIAAASGDLITADGCIRPNTSLEALGVLKPAFRPDGVVTAGNSSTLSDGAAMVLVGLEEDARRDGLKPMARIVASAIAGVEPRDIFMAPVPAVRAVLAKAGLTTDQIGLYEINEAFSSQTIACIRALELDPARVNVHGGAIALGHPIGASGARVLVTLSEDGWEFFAEAIREANVVESDIVAPLTSAQAGELAGLLERLIEGLDESEQSES